MKNCDNLLKEYARKLVDEDLRFLFFRYQQMLFGDRYEIVNFLSQSRELNNWLTSAASSTEFLDAVDAIGEFVQKEHSRRFDKVKPDA